jgi:A/G-specific adenine glycosylase
VRLTKQKAYQFQEEVRSYYREYARDLPWRQPEPDTSFDPYKIMISEVMLQQTQVPRVIEKYRQFIEVYPTPKDLAEASLSDVLAVWQGLGYNRRARFLREAAVNILHNYNGKVPDELEHMIKLPGIGHNTAVAILVYAHNQAHVFIETNIRTVYIHHFYSHETNVTDKNLLGLIDVTMDRENSREWYWALMDYGSWLKKEYGNANRRSRHYSRQSAFEGSSRQLRGHVLRILAEGPRDTASVHAALNDCRSEDIINGLVRDGLIVRGDKILRIAD